jgi:tetratricopeptide (TPR) repeat protein
VQSSNFPRFLSVFAVLFALSAAPVVAHAQDDKEDAAAKQQLAKELYTAGKQAQADGNLELAITKFREAFDAYPDPGLQFLIGDLLRQDGRNDEAVAAWKKFVELAEPQAIENNNEELLSAVGKAKERIAKVEEEIVEADKKRKEEEERKLKEIEEKKRLEEEARRREAAKLPLAVNGMLLAGVDQRMTVVGRVMGGGMLRFGKFAPEAHVGFDVFLQAGGESKGTRGQSLTLIDLGARYAIKDETFKGPYVAAGGAFGLFLGSPRKVALEGDMATCGGGDCQFEVDKHLAGRVGVGYGFGSSEKTTVGIRLDFMYWAYSVAGDQPAGGVTAGQVEKPQTAFSVTVGLEALRWR